MSYLFTSESVGEGHPDKVCDAISDAILDNLLEQDPESHVACETLATTGTVIVSGEVRSNGDVDVEKIVKKNEPLIIICRSGRRSRIVANLLKENDLYSTIYHATNGIISWIDSKKRTTKPNQNSFLR